MGQSVVAGGPGRALLTERRRPPGRELGGLEMRGTPLSLLALPRPRPPVLEPTGCGRGRLPRARLPSEACSDVVPHLKKAEAGCPTSPGFLTGWQTDRAQVAPDWVSAQAEGVLTGRRLAGRAGHGVLLRPHPTSLTRNWGLGQIPHLGRGRDSRSEHWGQRALPGRTACQL